jgi:hypothetical protein
MPSYIVKGNTSGNSCCTPSNNDSCQSSISFFATLSQKMLDMVNTIKQQFEEMKENCTPKEVKGFFLASIEAPKQFIGVKVEYLEYIKRYGPPKDGIFDNTLLEQLRIELGVETF